MMTVPDGLLGAALAAETIGLSCALVNGPGGCRSRMQTLLHDLAPGIHDGTACCRSSFFSRQQHLPCTFLDDEDLVFGSEDKVSEAVRTVTSITGRRPLVVDTLAASMHCYDSPSDTISIAEDLSEMGFSEGYDTAACAILAETDLDGGNDGSVNILGYGVTDLGWKQGSREIERLLALMGVKINCVLGCMPDPDVAKGLGKAALNIMVRPELCRRTSDHLEKRFGIPSLRPTAGAPVGYPSTRSFVREVADAMGADPSPALEFIDEEAKSVHSELNGYDRAIRGLHSKGFAIVGESSTTYPLMRWLMESFGMAPFSVELLDSEYERETLDLLESSGFSDAVGGPDHDSEIVFCDGLRALEGRLNQPFLSFVETGMPYGRMVNLVGRTLVGTTGCRYILDEMMNGLIRFRCGQPTDPELLPKAQRHCMHRKTYSILPNNLQ